MVVMTEQNPISEWEKTHPPTRDLIGDRILMYEKMIEYLDECKDYSPKFVDLMHKITAIDIFAKNLYIVCKNCMSDGVSRADSISWLTSLSIQIDSKIKNPLIGEKKPLIYLQAKIKETIDLVSHEPMIKKPDANIPDKILIDFYKEHSVYFPDCTNSTDFVSHFKEGKELKIKDGYKQAICNYFRLFADHYNVDHISLIPVFGKAIQKQKTIPQDKIDLFEPFYKRVKKG
jgi:hypothetical protein